MPKKKSRPKKKSNKSNSKAVKRKIEKPKETEEDDLGVAATEKKLKKKSSHQFEKKTLQAKKKKKLKSDAPVEVEVAEDQVDEDMAVPAPIEAIVGPATATKVSGARKNDQEIERELNQIYGDEDGSIPDMKHFEEKKRSRLFAATVVLLGASAVLAGVAWIGFFVLQPQSRFNEADVILSVAGDEVINAGQETHYRIRYRNAQNVPLAKVMLQVRYPEGFVFEKSDPEAAGDNNDEWALGSLEEQDSGYIDVWGRMYGDLGKKQSFRVFLNYFPANFSSEFQKVSTLSTEVTDSPVSLVVAGSDKVSMGAETEFVITLENKDTSSSTEHLALVIEPGEYFTMQRSEPAVDEDNKYQWMIDEVEDTQEIQIVGSFGQTIDEDKAGVVFKLLHWKDAALAGDGYVIQSVTHETEISKTEVSANLVINGTTSDFSTQPGEVLHQSIVIQNNSGSIIKDISAKIVLDAPSTNNKSMLKWLDLEDEADGRVVGEQLSQKLRRGSITWTSRDVPGLASLGPGDEAIIDISLPIKTVEDIELTDFSNFEIVATVSLEYEKDGEDQTLSSNQIKILVNSDVEIGVRDEVESVDRKDVHTVTWIISNTFHELKDISVEADLYGEISVPEADIVVPAGTANYDTDNQQLKWVVDSMPTSLDVLALQFDVIVEKENLSQTNLTSKVRFRAVDAVTEEEIVLVGDEVLLNGQL